jgi:xanthine/CO dehydrogenase XdhC/CoxF family maturation factor
LADNDDILETARRWLQAGHEVALATVVETWGSAPRTAGSKLAVRSDGTFVGSVSGGCVEGAVIEAAGEVMRDHKARALTFGVTDELAWSVGLACGGQIEIFVEPVD